MNLKCIFPAFILLHWTLYILFFFQVRQYLQAFTLMIFNCRCEKSDSTKILRRYSFSTVSINGRMIFFLSLSFFIFFLITNSPFAVSNEILQTKLKWGKTIRAGKNRNWKRWIKCKNMYLSCLTWNVNDDMLSATSQALTIDNIHLNAGSLMNIRWFGSWKSDKIKESSMWFDSDLEEFIKCLEIHREIERLLALWYFGAFSQCNKINCFGNKQNLKTVQIKGERKANSLERHKFQAMSIKSMKICGIFDSVCQLTEGWENESTVHK